MQSYNEFSTGKSKSIAKRSSFFSFFTWTEPGKCARDGWMKWKHSCCCHSHCHWKHVSDFQCNWPNSKRFYRLCSSYFAVCFAGYNEKRLLHDLLDTYNTLERPVVNESDPLQISFGLTLMQIIDVDEKNQMLVTNIWLKLVSAVALFDFSFNSILFVSLYIGTIWWITGMEWHEFAMEHFRVRRRKRFTNVGYFACASFACYPRIYFSTFLSVFFRKF